VTDLLTTITAGLTEVLALVPLQTVRPTRGNGFAGSIIGALMAIGLLIVVAKFATTKPKNRRRPPKS
jgi:hypothetical protein